MAFKREVVRMPTKATAKRSQPELMAIEVEGGRVSSFVLGSNQSHLNP
jgi:hypothetical protein